jgi:hypothetical protein
MDLWAWGSPVNDNFSLTMLVITFGVAVVWLLTWTEKRYGKGVKRVKPKLLRRKT